MAGETALNVLVPSSRLSNDIDLFHDFEEALEATWESDRKLFEASGYLIALLRRRPDIEYLSVAWRTMLDAAREVVRWLPPAWQKPGRAC